MARSEASILHLDLDAFFASVEQLLDPELRGRPVVVAGLGARGVVSAASYEARRYGVRSAMPTARARRACPDGVFLPPRMREYESRSRLVMAILRSVTPLVEPISLDEAFLDVAGARRLYGTGPEIAALLRQRIREETGLTASVGVAPTKFLAKIASDLAKPDGLFVVEPGRELDVLHPLPVERLWGVGPATLARLARMGVKTVGDLAVVPREALVGAVGKAHGEHLYALAHNVDDRDVVPTREVRSVGNEETFPADLRERRELEREIVRLADKVASRLRAAGLAGRTVTLKVRYGDFTTVTRSETGREPVDTAAVLVRTARELLASTEIARGVRLLGISVSHLAPSQGPAPAQGVFDLEGLDDLGAHDDARRAAVERAVDDVRRRFGHESVQPATLLVPDQEERR